MIKIVLVCLFGIYFIISIPITIIYSIVQFVCRLKCRKMHYNKYSNPCHNEDCKWSRHCDDYRHIYTDEEEQKINQLITNIKDLEMK